MLKKTGRVLAIILTILVIILSLGGIVGAWYANSTLTNITARAFAVVDTAVSVVDTGVGRVETLVQTGRTEVQQTADTIVSVADELRANRPILTALSERVETRLGPTVDQIRETLTPVREALTTAANVVSLANSIPFISERVPRLDAIDQVFTRLSDLAADIRQLRTTLREAAVSEADRMTQQAVDVLTGVTTRIDNRLAETQANVEQVRADIQALRDHMEARKTRLLLIYDLTALGLTLFLLWVIYSQVVVMRYHWHLLRAPAASPVIGGSAAAGSPPAAATSAAAVAAAAPAKPEPAPAPTAEVAPVESPAADVESAGPPAEPAEG